MQNDHICTYFYIRVVVSNKEIFAIDCDIIKGLRCEYDNLVYIAYVSVCVPLTVDGSVCVCLSMWMSQSVSVVVGDCGYPSLSMYQSV